MLLARGAQVNARQQGGWTPLHPAAHNGDGELARLLLNNSADPNLASDDGKTLLTWQPRKVMKKFPT
jgi:ankyrin repeat protein